MNQPKLESTGLIDRQNDAECGQVLRVLERWYKDPEYTLDDGIRNLRAILASAAEKTMTDTTADEPRPQRGALDHTTIFRINSTAAKVNDAFNAAKAEARDECLWLSAICRELLADNDRLRVVNEKLLLAAERERRAPDGEHRSSASQQRQP